LHSGSRACCFELAIVIGGEEVGCERHSPLAHLVHLIAEFGGGTLPLLESGRRFNCVFKLRDLAFEFGDLLSLFFCLVGHHTTPRGLLSMLPSPLFTSPWRRAVPGWWMFVKVRVGPLPFCTV